MTAKLEAKMEEQKNIVAEGEDGTDGRSSHVGRRNYKKMIVGT